MNGIIDVIVYRSDVLDEGEMGLVINDEVVFLGDWYHTKASVYIDGFIDGMRHCGYTVNIKDEYIGEDHPMFDKLGFMGG